MKDRATGRVSAVVLDDVNKYEAIELSQLEKIAQGLFVAEPCELDKLLDEAINEDPNPD